MTTTHVLLTVREVEAKSLKSLFAQKFTELTVDVHPLGGALALVVTTDQPVEFKQLTKFAEGVLEGLREFAFPL